MKKHLKAKRRAIYPYKCAGCRKRRLTRNYDRAIAGLCFVCKPRERAVNPNQTRLF
ncbi:MAG TPA: hypothetical protein VIG74_04395 [Alphaproteobacteria bacterium]|jgi:predicted SprT family Zn-dependent metalloprotease